MFISHRTFLNRHFLRVVALWMFVFPEPVVSNLVGVGLFAVSFAVDREVPGSATGSCRCDYHRRGHVEFPPLGAGALIGTPRLAWPRLSPSSYAHQRYGFVPVAAPATTFGMSHTDPWGGRDVPHCYGWHSLPKLEGALFRRLSGFGSKAAVRCEVSRRHAGAVA